MGYTSSVQTLKKINGCRLFKKLLFPFEVVGFNGRKRTAAYDINMETSQVKWKYNFRAVTHPSKATWRVWKQFLCWLLSQKICFTYDVNIQSIAMWWVDMNDDYLIHKHNDEHIIYKRGNGRTPQYERWKVVHRYDVRDCEPALVNKTKKGRIVGVQRLSVTVQYVNNSALHANQVRDTETDITPLLTAIETNTAIICIDIAVKRSNFAFCAIFTDIIRSFDIRFQQATNQWVQSKRDSAEGRALLAVLKYVFDSIPQETKGIIDIHMGSTSSKKWASQVMTASRACQSGGEIWVAVKKIITQNDRVTINFFRRRAKTRLYNLQRILRHL